MRDITDAPGKSMSFSFSADIADDAVIDDEFVLSTGGAGGAASR